MRFSRFVPDNTLIDSKATHNQVDADLLLFTDQATKITDLVLASRLPDAYPDGRRLTIPLLFQTLECLEQAQTFLRDILAGTPGFNVPVCPALTPRTRGLFEQASDALLACINRVLQALWDTSPSEGEIDATEWREVLHFIWDIHQDLDMGTFSHHLCTQCPPVPTDPAYQCFQQAKSGLLTYHSFLRAAFVVLGDLHFREAHYERDMAIVRDRARLLMRHLAQ